MTLASRICVWCAVLGLVVWSGGHSGAADTAAATASPPRVCVVQITASGKVVSVLVDHPTDPNIAVLVPPENATNVPSETATNVPVSCQDLTSISLAVANQEPSPVSLQITVFTHQGTPLCTRGPFTLSENGARGVVLGNECIEVQPGIVVMSSCGRLDRPGTVYMLDRDLGPGSVTPNCMQVEAQHVTLDCQGHSIADPSIETPMISSVSDYTTVRHCVVTASSRLSGGNGNGAGIKIEANYATVEDNEARDSFWGIWIIGHHNVIRYNTVQGNAKGIHLSRDDNLVANNLVKLNNHYQSWGLGVWEGQRNRFINNKEYGSSYGLVLYSANETHIDRCGVLSDRIYLYSNTTEVTYGDCPHPDCTWVGDICVR